MEGFRIYYMNLNVSPLSNKIAVFCDVTPHSLVN